MLLKGFTIKGYCYEGNYSYKCKPDSIELVNIRGIDPRMAKVSCGDCFCYVLITEPQMKRLTKSMLESGS